MHAKPFSFFMVAILAGWLCSTGHLTAADPEPSTAPEASKEVDPTDDVSHAPHALHSPRATMRTFLVASGAGDYATAATCLQFSSVTTDPDARQRAAMAERLKSVIDRMAWVDLAAISDHADAAEYRFPPGASDQPIVITQDADGAWRFGAETVQQIDTLYAQWKDKPKVVSGVPWYRKMTPIGNEAWRIAALFISILIAWIIARVVKLLLVSSSHSFDKRNRVYGAVTLRALSKTVVPLMLVAGLKTGISFLVMNPVVESVASTVVSVLFTLAISYVVWCLVDVVNTWLTNLAARTASKLDDMLAPLVQSSLRVTVVVLSLVQVATALSDKPMTSIIAGLSVGGLAIGLAAQDMIKNFFGSVMIFSDRPFEMGDRIQVDAYDGTVESVGFRSTRIRTADGHLITFPNGELANKAIRNVAKRPYLKRSLNLGVTYDTSADQLRRAVAIVHEILADHEGMDVERPPRVFFTEFNDSAMNVAVTYWYHPADWWAFNAFNERVNLEILERFNAEGLEFAFPSQTVYLAGGETDTPTAPG